MGQKMGQKSKKRPFFGSNPVIYRAKGVFFDPRDLIWTPPGALDVVPFSPKRAPKGQKIDFFPRELTGIAQGNLGDQIFAHIGDRYRNKRQSKDLEPIT